MNQDIYRYLLFILRNVYITTFALNITRKVISLGKKLILNYINFVVDKIV